EQGADLGFAVAAVPAERADRRELAGLRPARDRLRVDAEHGGDLSRGQQRLGIRGASGHERPPRENRTFSVLSSKFCTLTRVARNGGRESRRLEDERLVLGTTTTPSGHPRRRNRRSRPPKWSSAPEAAGPCESGQARCCDDQAQERSGVTRPPKACNAEIPPIVEHSRTEEPSPDSLSYFGMRVGKGRKGRV